MYSFCAHRNQTRCKGAIWADRKDMDATWFDLGTNEGVLEFPEPTEGGAPALELHVVVTSKGVIA